MKPLVSIVFWYMLLLQINVMTYLEASGYIAQSPKNDRTPDFLLKIDNTERRSIQYDVNYTMIS